MNKNYFKGILIALAVLATGFLYFNNSDQYKAAAGPTVFAPYQLGNGTTTDGFVLKSTGTTTFAAWVSTSTLGLLGTATAASTYLQLNQTTPQTVINGAPIFNAGLKVGTSTLITEHRPNETTTGIKITEIGGYAAIYYDSNVGNHYMYFDDPLYFVGGSVTFNSGLFLGSNQTGAVLSAADQVLNLTGLGGTYNENLTIDFDGAEDNTIYFGSVTGANVFNFAGDIRLAYDNNAIKLGANASSSIYYNASDLILEIDNGGAGIVRYDSAYAEIYVADGSTAQTIATGATYTKLTAYTTNGIASNATADAANDKITINKEGKYLVNGSFNFSGDTSGANWRGALFYDGAEQANIHWTRKLGASGDIGSASFTGFLNASSSKDIDVRARHDGGEDETITIEHGNLNIHYIGE